MQYTACNVRFFITLYVYLEPVAQRSDDLQKMFEIIKKVQVENANVLGYTNQRRFCGILDLRTTAPVIIYYTIEIVIKFGFYRVCILKLWHKV